MGINRNLSKVPEVLTVSGSNVGIGATSPSAKLSVTDTSNSTTAVFSGASGGAYSTFNIMTLGANGNGYWRASTIGGNIKMISNAPAISVNGFSASAIAFGSDANQGRIGFFTTTSTTGDTVLSESMRIDTNGNVGIGTGFTPATKLHLYASNNSASVRLQNTAANKVWELNPSNPDVSNTGFTIYNVTDNTKPFHITDGGNVLIGTTTDAGYKLDVNGTGRFSGNLNINSAIQFRYNGAFRGQIVDYNAYGGGSDYSPFFTSETSLAFGVNGNSTKALMIASNGNVGINTTSPSSKFEVKTGTGASFRAASLGTNQLEISNYSTADGYRELASIGSILSFYTGTAGGGSASERMRITTDGFLKLTNTGTYYSSTGLYHEIASNTDNNNAIIIRNTASGSPYGPWIYFPNSSTSNTSTYYIAGSNSAGNKFFIWSNGSMSNATGVYGTISDIKYKENIADASSKLEDILELKVRNFNFIGDDTKQIGFIAQEFEEVFPGMVDISTERTEDGEEGETYKSIKTSVLTPILVKAMQELAEQVKEQNTIIQELTERIKILENN